MSQQFFRRDIEGLRAIAVSGVLVYHLSPGILPGGFTGVDIFFVISGFLITRSIVSEIESGHFSLFNFYARRIRRLMPAYLAVIFACFIVGYFILLPKEFKFFSASAFYSTIYASNIIFMLEDSYFSNILKNSLLLHTWSLSVEEQFYLFFPIFTIITMSFSRRKTISIWIIVAIASFALAEVMLRVNSAYAFFLSPSRFWQFIAGALIVLTPTLALDHQIRRAVVALGLLFIAASYMLIDADVAFPGLAAVAPTIGAVFVIAGGKNGSEGAFNLVLQNSVTDFIGKTSYSIYLWHWPIIVTYRLAWGPLDDMAKLVLGALSLLAGYLSWRFVESPFRGFPIAQRGRLFAFAGGASLICGAATATILILEGLPGRYTTAQAAAAEYIDYDPRPVGPYYWCFLQTDRDTNPELFDEEACLPKPSDGLRIALLGDSHANQFASAFRVVWPDAAIAQITASGCRPVVGGSGNPVCHEILRRALEEFVPNGDFDYVVLAGRWQIGDVAHARETVDRLRAHGQQVVVFGPLVEYVAAVPRLLAFSPVPGSGSAEQWARLSSRRAVEAALTEALDGSGAVYVSIIDLLCPNDACTLVTSSGVPMHWDFAHLTRPGAQQLLERMRSDGLFEGAGSASADVSN